MFRRNSCLVFAPLARTIFFSFKICMIGSNMFKSYLPFCTAMDGHFLKCSTNCMQSDFMQLAINTLIFR